MNEERGLNKRNGVVVFFPALIMFLLSAFLSLDLAQLGTLDLKGLLIASLIIIFPILFFLQGIMISKKHMGIVFPYIVSAVSFIVVALIFFNSSAIGYIVFYTICEALGYFSNKIIRWIKS
ncbi:hypothetical protein [Clostridium sp. LIBA-8841]|uniref:hypothetical protein n=1 Tax=Clostridium sp. LIBA-8841 TaxID=2987530 RepID=UPI002AC5AFBD|nr:hypothetical protein [Clostridium sp. LIBA-8841]MDZ5253849.1 hypothetical protein [Clostridium sp. LIBA-8841]